MSAPSHPARHKRYVAIEFSPTSGCLGSIVSVVTDFCRNVVDDPGVKFAFQLAAYELTENLVKYAIGDRTRLCISVESTVRGPALVLLTENEAAPDRLADAAARLSAAEAAPDPIEHFDRLVRESLASPTESRLGIGRLRAEGDLEISHEVTDRLIRIQVCRAVRTHEEGKLQ
jgi:hypothetical protein